MQYLQKIDSRTEEANRYIENEFSIYEKRP